MNLGFVGLGRMGSNMVRRIMRAGHHCVVYDINDDARAEMAKEGATAAASLEDLVARIEGAPRAVWIMLPAGRITEQTADELAPLLGKGDIIVDGGNSYYKDAIRRGRILAERGIDFVDCGTSGGVFGIDRGYCMMIGGDSAAVEHLDPIFSALAPGIGDIARTPNRENFDPNAEQGYLHVGPAGSGHFVKMVHNGIEYGIMQAYAEGFDILANKNQDTLPDGERFELNAADIAEVWRRGSVISSWLLDLTSEALARDVALSAFTGTVPDSGEGRWTIEAAIEEAVPADVLATSLFTRFRSRKGHTFGEKVLSAMRHGFGGHTEDQPDVNAASESD